MSQAEVNLEKVRAIRDLYEDRRRRFVEEAAGLIRRVREGVGPTPAVYALPELINIAEGRQVFG